MPEEMTKRELGGWWMYILGLMVVSILVFTGLNYAGIIGQTAVERVVFEQSYQYTAAQKAKIATLEAQLAENTSQLSNPDLEDSVRANLESQAAGLRVQLATAKAVQ
ncbi:hypothetical protein HQ524_04280 [Candidatus Uhrbacteria bacterium]|nr:hypothetical protein [Candidatus Uhrbacteria bacterium]